MKKCPNCQKEFPDTMRFCQTDGTPLVEAAGEADDPLKTTVMRQDDIASSIPSSDPYKTVVGSGIGQSEEEDDDLLQLPDEIDPMKTMVVPPLVGQNKPKEKLDADDPFGDVLRPAEAKPVPPPPAADYSAPPSDSPFAPPAPPKFNEPDVAPPSFDDLSGKNEIKDEPPPTVFQNPVDAGSLTPPSDSPFSGASPYGKKDDAPIPSPFDNAASSFGDSSNREEPAFGTPQSGYNEPPSPFGQPASPFDAPKPSFQEPESGPFGSAQQQFDQMNQPQFGQPLQQTEWTPPPAPNASWQEQGLGPQTPFQPPAAGQGLNQTLPIVSLVFGIVSLCCYISPVTGLVALITGFMGMKNANNDPNQYGGKGLAIAGMITGGVFFLIGVLYWLYIIFVIGLAGLSIMSQ